MDGLLVIDKPSGPTSHDVVARMRRVLGERRIGHTGTLDPLATGVLPLVIGRATRLARFLSASDKSYEAVIQLGAATDTGDSDGSVVGLPYSGPMPTVEVIDRALDAFRGQFLQQPPVFSAKKIAGKPSHRRVRLKADTTPVTLPAPVRVTATIAHAAIGGDRVTLQITCSAGFYVRALAHDLGERLGTGGHLIALRRTRAGELTLAQAVALDEAGPQHVIPLGGMLTSLPAMTLDAAGVTRTLHGRDLAAPSGFGIRGSGFVRLVDETGDLVAIAEPLASDPAILHPSVVLR